jgi:hypothetical protein
LLAGAAICLSADCHAVFHLCHHWNAGMNTVFLLLFPSNNVSQIYTFSAHNMQFSAMCDIIMWSVLCM